MKNMKPLVVLVIMLLMLTGVEYVYARGGSHMCSGHRGECDPAGREGERGRNEERDRHDDDNAVNVYRGGWGWGWGPAGVLVADEVVDEPSTVVVEQEQAPVQQQTVAGAPAYGTIVTDLPPGSMVKHVQGVTAYENNSVWYRPHFGDDGVDYMVIAPPPSDNE
ncbi:MAG: hypothetical protein WC779_00860 [Candidatus Omnitrophota bacterium]|jgi:hypothetical protein